MLNITGLEFGFGVSEPEGDTLRVDIECTFKDGSSTCKLILRGLPTGVLQPLFSTMGKCVAEGEGKKNSHATSGATDTLFELLTFATTIFMKFFKVFDTLPGCAELRLLSFLSLKIRVRGNVVIDVVFVLL